MKLRLPSHLTLETLAIALALTGASCGDDGGPTDASSTDAPVTMDAPARDAPSGEDARVRDAPSFFDVMAEYFCIPDDTVDATGIDGAVCSTTVTNPEDCPPGCRAVG